VIARFGGGLLAPLLRWWRALRAAPLSLLATLSVGVYLLMALFGGMIAPYPYTMSHDDPSNCITRANGTTRCSALVNQPPSMAHPLGTDRNGRDVWSRLLVGAGDTIGLPLLATSLAVALGAALGLTMGYWGGWYDEILSRLMDGLLAIPSLILALVSLSSLVPLLDAAENPLVRAVGAVNLALIVVIVLLYTPIVGRVVRSAALGVRDKGYVEAARLRGESAFAILTREILPSILPILTVEAALRFSYAVFLVASLGFLGLGAQPPRPEWGRMVLDARETALMAPHALWWPIAAIVGLILSINLAADGLQRAFRVSGQTE